MLLDLCVFTGLTGKVLIFTWAGVWGRVGHSESRQLPFVIIPSPCTEPSLVSRNSLPSSTDQLFPYPCTFIFQISSLSLFFFILSFLQTIINHLIGILTKSLRLNKSKAV